MIKILLLLLFILSCNSKEFKVGECVHQADSMEVFKIQSKKNDLYQIQSQNSQKNLMKSLNGSWIITDCP